MQGAEGWKDGWCYKVLIHLSDWDSVGGERQTRETDREIDIYNKSERKREIETEREWKRERKSERMHKSKGREVEWEREGRGRVGWKRNVSIYKMLGSWCSESALIFQLSLDASNHGYTVTSPLFHSRIPNCQVESDHKAGRGKEQTRERTHTRSLAHGTRTVWAGWLEVSLPQLLVPNVSEFPNPDGMWRNRTGFE